MLHMLLPVPSELATSSPVWVLEVELQEEAEVERHRHLVGQLASTMHR